MEQTINSSTINAAPTKSNLDTFFEVYAQKLAQYVRTKPERYDYSIDQVPIVVKKMRTAFLAGHANKEGPAFRATCKALGIPYTYKAIYTYLKQNEAA